MFSLLTATILSVHPVGINTIEIARIHPDAATTPSEDIARPEGTTLNLPTIQITS
ncbi:MAG: hypothetical protein AAF198_01845 [Pseudomonadota bacterium]